MFKTGTSLKRGLKLLPAVGAIFAVLALAGTTLAGEKRNDELFTQITAIPIPGNPAGTDLVSFDISWVDPVLHLYYLGDRSNKTVDVIDTSTTPPSFLTQFKPTSPTAPLGFVGFTGSNDTSGPDGVITVEHTQLWVGDGMSRVWVLDAKTGATVNTGNAPNPIPTSSGPNITIPNNPNRADELCFDPVDHLVMVANNADDPPFASLISTQTYTVVKQIPFDGSNGAPTSNNGAEQCQWSPRTGLFYISIPGIAGLLPAKTHGGVAVINPKSMKVVKTFIIPTDSCEAPQGMAVGPDPQILLGCNATSPNGVFNTAIINEHSGHVIATLANEGGDDEVWFNPGDGHYFLAGGSFRPNEQLGIVDSRFRTEDQTIQTGTPNGTARNAHSVAADLNTNLVFVPIPGTGGGGSLMPPTVGFQSSLCGQTSALQQAGCVAVFGTTNDDRPIALHERGADDKQE
jgi:hypothetical protein